MAAAPFAGEGQRNPEDDIASRRAVKHELVEDVTAGDDYDEMEDVPLGDDDDLARKRDISEDDSSEEDANRTPQNPSRLLRLKQTLVTSWRVTQRITNTVLVQDDDPLYGRGTLGVFSGVYISYMQNILLLSIIFIRLPWIVGFLGLSLASAAVFIAFGTVFLSSFSVVAIATNGSDRLYGGPFTTIAYSLGKHAAVVAGIMLCLANCGFTAFSVTVCTELIERYARTPNLLPPKIADSAFHNDPTAIEMMSRTPYYVHSILFFALLALITLFNAFGKRIIKWFCWIPFAVFFFLFVATVVAFAMKKAQKDIDLRCIFQPSWLRPKDRYEDQVPVTFYLPMRYTIIPPLQQRSQPSLLKEHCKHPSNIVNCSSKTKANCYLGTFRLKAFEWNFHVVHANLHGHIVDVSNIHSYDWRTIVYDNDFFGSVFISADVKFASVLGCALLVLPLFTGTVCGINIPSTLKSPTKNIPTGVFSSLLTMLILVMLLVLSLAFGVDRHLLLDKYGYGAYPSLPVVLAVPYPKVPVTGVILMSVIAAIQSMHTAKSLLLSILTSQTIPVPRFFFKRTSKRRALLAVTITVVLVAPLIFLNSVDYICIVASSCMLIALIVINLGALVCSALNFPSFLPAFTLFRSFLALLGIVGCTALLYGCKPHVGLTVSAVAILSYMLCPLYRRRFPRNTCHDIVVYIANMLLYSSSQKTYALVNKEFGSKPRCIVFTRFPASCDNLLRMAKILSQNRFAVYLSLIRDTGEQENVGIEDVLAARECMDYIDLPGYATQFKYQKISSLHSIASALARCCGLGAFQSNTVMIEYPSEAALKGMPDSLLYHYHMHRVCVRHCNLVVVKGTFPLNIKPVQSNQTIDIWWIIDNGDVLLMVAKMLKQHKIWYKAKVRLFLVVDIVDDIKEIEHALLLWLLDNRYVLNKIEFIRADSWIIQDYTQLRKLQIKQRYCKVEKQTCVSYMQRLLGIPDGQPVQNAVDTGFREAQHSGSSQLNTIVRTDEMKQRARHLNKEILGRSSDTVLVLLNMPEPPANLERFWKYLIFLDDLSSGLKKVLFVRGVDIQPNVDLETPATKDATI